MRSRMGQFFGSLVVLLIGTTPLANAGTPPTNMDEKVVAEDFSLKSLSTDQERLLKPWLGDNLSETPFQDWVSRYDYLASAYLAITRALSEIEFLLADGRALRGIDMVEHVNVFEGDRIRVRLNPELFKLWEQNDGKFRFHLANGKIETGSMGFTAGDKWGGSLHQGYDIQGFTSATKIPRLQVNYRRSDSEADIDLDGYPPFLGGIIPNPRHLSWENSDVRYWLPEYVAKFGDPGFQVKSTESL